MDTQTSPDCFQKEAGNEFNEKTSIIQEDINHLKKWLAKQPHLHAKEGQFESQYYITLIRPLFCFR